MLLRQIVHPREEGRYFDFCRLQLANGFSVYAEVRLKPEREAGGWFVCLNKVPHPGTGEWIANTPDRVDHVNLGEFEAQAVLDHYVQTYGLPEEVTP